MTEQQATLFLATHAVHISWTPYLEEPSRDYPNGAVGAQIRATLGGHSVVHTCRDESPAGRHAILISSLDELARAQPQP